MKYFYIIGVTTYLNLLINISIEVLRYDSLYHTKKR